MSRLSYAVLLSEVSKLKELVVNLTEKCNLVVAKYNQVVAEYAALKARFTESEHRLNKTSRNSHKPPPPMVWPNPRLRARRSPKVPVNQGVNRVMTG